MRCWSRTPGPSLRRARGPDSRRREPPRPNPGRRHRRGRRAPGHRRRPGAPRWPGASAGLLTVRGGAVADVRTIRTIRTIRGIVKVGDDHGLLVAERLVRDPGQHDVGLLDPSTGAQRGGAVLSTPAMRLLSGPVGWRVAEARATALRACGRIEEADVVLAGIPDEAFGDEEPVVVTDLDDPADRADVGDSAAPHGAETS